MTIEMHPPQKRGYEPAVGPRLRYLMLVVFVLCALLGVNSAYLSAITWMEWWSEHWGTGQVYQDYFYLWMVLLHLVLGLLVLVPFLVFAGLHLRSSRNRKNRRAVKIGYALFGASLALLISGLLLMRIGVVELRHPAVRGSVYVLHQAMPLVVLWLYWLHRLAGPRIRWRAGLAYGAIVLAFAGGMAWLQSQDPRRWNVTGPASGEAYFSPSLARTASGNFIPAGTLMRDQYCLECHADAYKGWFHSAHHFSSFNNPMYLASVRETREVSFKRDGSVQAARWCAGCHDPVPFFSGAFDDPKFDDVQHPTANAGITCTSCHSITHVNSPRGNADYTIEEPLHYPFANSENSWLQTVNRQLVKAKPAFHKKTFLKSFHRTEEFCSTCHKVHLPYELNHYREFLRGQNHYDPFLLSGASGNGARSNYYGMRANESCSKCHMPLKESSDFGAQLFAGAKQLSIHNHLFLGANTALPALRDEPEIVAAHQDFLKTAARIDLFGLKEGGTIEGKLHAPLRPDLPELGPGQTYLLETVIRNLKVGHHLTQGTVDSNELWVEVTASSGGRLLAQNGQIDDRGEVDRNAHFINVYMLDRNGKRIDRRNPQDIYTPLYNHQIPPGSAQVAHYRLTLPEQLDDLVTVEVKLQYRKFDQAYWEFVTASARPGDNPIPGQIPGRISRNPLPVTTLASDRIVFPITGVSKKAPDQAYPIVRDHIYMRWNDYGLALLGEGNGLDVSGTRSAELKQAEQIFRHLNDNFGYPDVRLHLGRVLLTEGRVEEAALAVQNATKVSKPLFFTEPVYAPWAINWMSGLVNRQLGKQEAAIASFRSVLTQQTQSMRDRGYDFSRDYIVHNELGQVLFEFARQTADAPTREKRLHEAISEFEFTLRLDPENATAHYNLGLIFARLGDETRSNKHSELHARYKLDDTAAAIPQQVARRSNPAVNRAAEGIVIYPLRPAPASVANPAAGRELAPKSATSP